MRKAIELAIYSAVSRRGSELCTMPNLGFAVPTEGWGLAQAAQVP